MTKCWIDPNHLLNKTKIIKNVVELKVYLERLPKEFAMRQNDCDLTTLETLEICVCDYSSNYVDIFTPKDGLLIKFKNLKKLDISLGIMINFLPDILRFLGNTKDLKISASLEVSRDLNEEETKEMFNLALEIVKEKFPFPCKRILDLSIFEANISPDDRRHEYFISYGKNGAILTTFDVNSDSESDTSNSMDESVISSDSMEESVDSSDFMDDESFESSDSMDENVDNSDIEDMNGQE